jgi:hypothetical protein
MKTQIKIPALAVAASLITAFSLWAQQPSSSNDQQMQGMQGMQMQNNKKGSQSQMMQSCQKNMRSMMASNDQTSKDIEAAKQSNDPAKMRAALDEAQKALSPMNDHMKNCMSMMNMMQNMNGMMGGQQSKPQTQNPPKQ